MRTRILMSVGVLAFGLVAPASAAPLATGRAQQVAASAPAPAAARPRAAVSGVSQVLGNGKVRVEVASNGKRVRVTWRTAGGAKRAVDVRLRGGVGARTLAAGANRIHCQALATSKLRRSPKVPVLLVPATPASPSSPSAAAPAQTPAQTQGPAAPSPSPSLMGDIDHDGQVGCADQAILLAEWGGASARSDLNEDGVVRIEDLSLLLASWTSTPTPCTTPDTTAPGPVSGLRVTGTTASSVSLAWTNPTAPDLSLVTVRRATGTTPPSGPAAGTPVTLANPTAVSVTDSGLQANTRYTYAVFTQDEAGNSGPAVPVGATTGPVIRSSGANDLTSGTALDPGGWLQSPDGRYKLVNQTDGNLVETVAATGRVVWSSGTAGRGAGRLVMQTDGNLVLYSTENGSALWTTGTSGASPQFAVQSDSNLVVHTSAGAMWASGTVDDQLRAGEWLHPGQSIHSRNGRYRLIQQGDGNLVAYDGSTPLWATYTIGSDRVTVMQGDGNLVTYAPGTVAVWSSRTAGSPGAWAIMQDDGNFVVYAASGAPLWSIRDNPLGNSAAAWAEARIGQVAYAYYCLAFATDAWEYGAGQRMTRYGWARLAWDSQAAKQHHNAAPPRGAMVFWSWYGTIDGEYRNWGHVAIADGNGNVITSYAGGTTAISRKSIASITLDGYLGWIMPPY